MVQRMIYKNVGTYLSSYITRVEADALQFCVAHREASGALVRGLSLKLGAWRLTA